jgi:acetate kinase
MSADMLLTLNAGSSTAKIALFEAAPSGARRVAKGTIDFRKDPRASASPRAL